MRARHLITAGCLAAAIALYSVGSRETAALLLLGIAFEGAFWYRLVHSKKKA